MKDEPDHSNEVSGGEGREAPDPTRTAETQSGRPPAPYARAPVPIPEVIGEFRILGKLGEGGMGIVYEAEQQHPKRKVALKVVRGGQFVDDSRVRMFQREADSLARLKHPNIGAIYESGRTEDGQHFFAMELVRGETLYAYLHNRSKSPSRGELDHRLRLFRQIADAVHYAHQRGVIHRDLKPSNVIVGEQLVGSDSTITGVRLPEIKILDFGLARITDTDVAAATMTTEIGMIKGTLPYMSPEQARGDPDGIDVRSDVYALGVMLYEMLTGTRPYDTMRASLIDAIRAICDEPPRPIRQAWSGEGRLDSDIETIVDKAIEKDPDRRYASAEALSEDIGRYLTSQPIAARPPSTVYQLKKFTRRNRVLVAGVAATIVVLFLGAAVSTFLGLREAAQRRAAEQARNDLATVVEFQADMLGDVDASGMGLRLVSDLRERVARVRRDQGASEDEVRAAEASFDGALRGVNSTNAALRLIDEDILARAVRTVESQLGGKPLIDARLRATIGKTYRDLGLYDLAEPHLQAAMEIRAGLRGRNHPENLESVHDMGELLRLQGRLDDAERYTREALDGRRGVLGPEHPDTLASFNAMAVLLKRQGKLAEAESYYRKALERRRRVLGEDHVDTLESVHDLGALLWEQGRLDEAEVLHREALQGVRRVLGDDHPHTLIAMNNLGLVLQSRGKLDEAEPYFREVLDHRRRILGDDHPMTLSSMNNMGWLLESRREYSDAESYYRETLERARNVLGDDHELTLTTLQNLGNVLYRQNSLTEAESLMTEAMRRRRRTLGDDHPDTIASIGNLGKVLEVQGRPAEAEPFHREEMERRRRLQGDDHPDTIASIRHLARVLEKQNKLPEAESLYAEEVELRRRTSPPKPAAIASSLIRLGIVLNKQKRHAAAEPILRECLEIRREALAAADALIPNTMSSLGESLAGQGKFEEAESLLIDAYSGLEAHPKARDTQKQQALARVIDLYVRWGRDAQADQWRSKRTAPTRGS